jgi:hypothetical protein
MKRRRKRKRDIRCSIDFRREGTIIRSLTISICSRNYQRPGRRRRGRRRRIRRRKRGGRERFKYELVSVYSNWIK